MLWHDTNKLLQAAGMKRLRTSACCLQCCLESCFVFKSLSRDGTVVPACGRVHAAGLCWPKSSLADCMGHRTGVCIHLLQVKHHLPSPTNRQFPVKSWRLIRECWPASGYANPSFGHSFIPSPQRCQRSQRCQL